MEELPTHPKQDPGYESCEDEEPIHALNLPQLLEYFLIHQFLFERRSATIAALTASTGDVIGGT